MKLFFSSRNVFLYVTEFFLYVTYSKFLYVKCSKLLYVNLYRGLFVQNIIYCALYEPKGRAWGAVGAQNASFINDCESERAQTVFKKILKKKIFSVFNLDLKTCIFLLAFL